MSNMVLKAYDGDLPYIFVSYAHKDSYRVLPIISALQDNGFRVWFDQGIEAGSEWSTFIVTQLKNYGNRKIRKSVALQRGRGVL